MFLINKFRKTVLAAALVLTTLTVHAISICKGTGSTGGGSSDFPADKTFVMKILTPTDRTFRFQISASGNYKIDWGDGTAVQEITKANTTMTTYSHTYPAASTNYTAKLSGLATGYYNHPSPSGATITFALATNSLVGIGGNLGHIFPIINNTITGSPRFFLTFSSCSKIAGPIPENLFAGLNGAPIQDMFDGTFSGCTGLTGTIPAGLFSGITGAPASGLFTGTFSGCTGLTGSIPSSLFAGISGAPASQMYNNTFSGCTGLTGSIPAGLFGAISGTPASYMYNNTFSGCTGLTGSIPVGLFGNLSGPAQNYMFYITFNGCTGLTGQSALMPDGVTHLYEQWPSATTTQVGYMYTNATGLADYATIPANWK
jgi:hypothetical protein